MRVKTLVLGSASLTILALAASPAFAQGNQGNGDAANPPSTTANQGTTPSPADAAQATPGAADNGADIVVTGIRRSLQSAQQIKRNAPQIVDSIVAEDIGKLPDVAVSDTAARIPGVEVERGGGEAGRVLIRGLPDFTTTYNGRDIFTAETRVVALQDFPAGAIAALEVYKTTTADLIEGGLAGEINVRSRRPFDFSGFQIAGSFWEQYARQSGVWKPNGNLMITDRWNTGIGEIGALVNFSYTRLQYLDSTRSNTDFVAQQPIGPNGQVVRFPDIQRTDYGSGDRERPSINAALQWRPTPGLEFYVDGLWQGFRNRISDREFEAPLWGAASYSNVTLVPGTNQVQSLTANFPFRPDGFQGGTLNRTDTYQFAIGGKYDKGPLLVSGDLARTRSKFTGDTESVDFALRNPQVVSANTGLAGGPGPAFSLANFNPADPNNYWFRGFFEDNQVARGDDWQGRVDLTYRLDSGFLSSVQAGLRYTDRNAHRREGNRYFGNDDILNQHIPLSAVPLDYELFHTGFSGDNVSTLDEWLAPTYQSIRANIEAMRQFEIAHGAPNYTSTDAAYDPGQSFDSNEKTYAAYAQANYRFDLGGGVTADGVVGVRAVKTDFSLMNINGRSSDHYTDWLPNASMRLRLTPDLQLRLSFDKTRTRPQFTQLEPATLGPPPGCLTDPAHQPPPASCVQGAGGGNPNLKSMKSNNYDASLEYYFSRTGFASIAAFRHDINGYIEPITVFSNPDAQGIPRLATSSFFNAGKGHIQGFEGQVNTFLDNFGVSGWLRAFGFQANVTYLDANIAFPTAVGAPSVSSPIIGISKWAYNLAAIYEAHGLSARLSWNHRSSWTSRFEYRGDPLTADRYQEITRGIGRLDFSASYDLTKNLTVTVDATNILNKPFRADLIYGFNHGADPAIFPRAVRYEESIYSFGFRFRF
jgi:iron complex outermembrane receptor protein